MLIKNHFILVIRIKVILRNILFLFCIFSYSLDIQAQTEPDTISFIHVSDIHFCNLDGYHPLFVEKRQHYGNIKNSLHDFFRLIPGKYKSDFIVITGDMIDFYEAESRDGSMIGTQIERFVNLAKICNIPIYMALGNHDIASYWISNNSMQSNQLHAMKARSQWIKNANCFKKGTYYSRTYQVDTTTYKLIFLDNGYYSPDRKDRVAKGLPSNIIDKYQLLWLDEQLKHSKKEVVLIFTHIPIFPPYKKEIRSSRNKYFLDLNDTLPTYHVYHESTNETKREWNLRTLLRRNASDRILIFSGHKHSTAYYKVQLSEDFSIDQILTGAFGRDTRNWRLIKLTSNRILISYPGIDDIQYHISTD